MVKLESAFEVEADEDKVGKVVLLTRLSTAYARERWCFNAAIGWNFISTDIR
jgi:hypothetical protein